MKSRSQFQEGLDARSEARFCQSDSCMDRLVMGGETLVSAMPRERFNDRRP